MYNDEHAFVRIHSLDSGEIQCHLVNIEIIRWLN